MDFVDVGLWAVFGAIIVLMVCGCILTSSRRAEQ